jgi:hypothetical protein
MSSGDEAAEGKFQTALKVKRMGRTGQASDMVRP